MKPGSLLAALFLTAAAIAHFLRVLLRADLIVGGWPVPHWMSVVATLFCAGVAVQLWRERRG